LFGGQRRQSGTEKKILDHDSAGFKGGVGGEKGGRKIFGGKIDKKVRALGQRHPCGQIRNTRTKGQQVGAKGGRIKNCGKKRADLKKECTEFRGRELGGVAFPSMVCSATKELKKKKKTARAGGKERALKLGGGELYGGLGTAHRCGGEKRGEGQRCTGAWWGPRKRGSEQNVDGLRGGGSIKILGPGTY